MKQQLNIILAPDSFKGSLTSLEQIVILEQIARQFFPDCVLHKLPIADGGEGTVDALVLATNGEYFHKDVTGPVYESVNAKYGKTGDTAIIEMAQASGLPLVPKHKRNPMNTTTIGTGELIREALDQHCRKIIIGIGGSATNDGGMGALISLGAKFYDDCGNELAGRGGDLIKLRRVDFTGLHSAIKNTAITVICDVTNPLLGERGATYVYGRQKGADDAMLQELEHGMENYAGVINDALGISIESAPGAGAAGGLGAVLGGVLDARLAPGIDTVLETVEFDKILKKVDLVITGEGNIDEQSINFGKVVAGISRKCMAQNIPVCVIAGGMGQGADKLLQIAQSSIITTINAAMPIETALENARELYENAAQRMFAFLKIGYDVSKNY